ncbi:MAG TPA: hypothetical protein PKN75_14555 [Bacteroidia bacterium]|nr:hypothetical protein [Bacteroidia bacterium]HNU34806.1 hypothetical protein [Bacteroidia bacterium]
MRNDKAVKLLLIGILLTIIAPYFLTRSWGLLDFSSTGQIGDTIGGITAPITSLIGAILVYFALKEQIKANKIIQDQVSDQKTISYKQQFESTFFKLLELHKSTIHNLDIEKNHLSPFKKAGKSEVLKSNEVLKELMLLEEPKMAIYFNIQGFKKIPKEYLHVLNYRALNNHFINKLDFLNIIISNITSLHDFIKVSTLNEQEKTFYTTILHNNLTDSEKFFLVIFYIQLESKIKSNLSFEEIKYLAGPKDWILNNLVVTDDFPFSIVGFCVKGDHEFKESLNSYNDTLQNFLNRNLYYCIEPINNEIIIQYCKAYLTNYPYDYFHTYSSMVSAGSINYINLKEFFNKYFHSSGKSISELQPIQFKNSLSKILDEQYNFEITIEVTLRLNEKIFSLTDVLRFQVQQNHGGGEFRILISSGNNKCSDDNWRWHSFSGYHSDQIKKKD